MLGPNLVLDIPCYTLPRITRIVRTFASQTDQINAWGSYRQQKKCLPVSKDWGIMQWHVRPDRWRRRYCDESLLRGEYEFVSRVAVLPGMSVVVWIFIAQYWAEIYFVSVK